ncbi:MULTISPECIES: geranylgeranylglycerol-phosphate geranylgeranyltransferase [Chitinophagaceae]
MLNVKYVLQLVRWQNLVIVFLAQYLFAYCLIAPFQPIFPKQVFYAVAFACVLTAAAGNIINDYYDRDIDVINKPEKVYIGKYITPKTALFFYFLFNAVALLLAFYADYRQYSIYTSMFVGSSIALLWAYSRYFKKSYLVGNLIVAFLTTAPMLLLTLLEIQDFGWAEQYPLLLFFMFFSFWTSLIREILKDCEDIIGDKAAQAHTLPIISGITTAKNIVFFLIAFVIGVLGVFGYFFFCMGNQLETVYVLLLILLFILLIMRLIKADSSKAFHRMSNMTKIIMLLGILLMLLIRLHLNLFS